MAAGHHFGNLGMSGGKNSLNFSEIGNSGILFEFQTVNIIGGFVVLQYYTSGRIIVVRNVAMKYW